MIAFNETTRLEDWKCKYSSRFCITHQRKTASELPEAWRESILRGSCILMVISRLQNHAFQRSREIEQITSVFRQNSACFFEHRSVGRQKTHRAELTNSACFVGNRTTEKGLNLPWKLYFSLCKNQNVVKKILLISHSVICHNHLTPSCFRMFWAFMAACFQNPRKLNHKVFRDRSGNCLLPWQIDKSARKCDFGIFFVSCECSGIAVQRNVKNISGQFKNR